jgi:hypothetical protein
MSRKIALRHGLTEYQNAIGAILFPHRLDDRKWIPRAWRSHAVPSSDFNRVDSGPSSDFIVGIA